MTDEQKYVLNNIVELIEDKQYPAKRNITDYVEMLFPYEERKEVCEYIHGLYKEYDRLTTIKNAMIEE